MSQAPYMPTWIGDLMAKTPHLGPEEFGCYHFLLYAMWQNNARPLPDDDRKLARICRMSLKRWRQVMRHVMVEFFDIEAGYWHQRRLEREWNTMCEKRQKLRANGAMGGRPRTNPKPLEIHERGKPNGSDLLTQMRSQSESEVIEEKEEAPSVVSPEGDTNTGAPAHDRRIARQEVPIDWQPDDDAWAYATSRGLDGYREVQRFKNHHLAKGSRLADFNHAFRAWIDGAERLGAGHGRGRSGGNGQGNPSIATILNRVVIPGEDPRIH